LRIMGGIGGGILVVRIIEVLYACLGGVFVCEMWCNLIARIVFWFWCLW